MLIRQAKLSSAWGGSPWAHVSTLAQGDLLWPGTPGLLSDPVQGAGGLTRDRCQHGGWGSPGRHQRGRLPSWLILLLTKAMVGKLVQMIDTTVSTALVVWLLSDSKGQPQHP